MNIQCRVLKTTTSDGIEIDALLFEPKKPTKTVIIHFHGKEGDFLQNHFIQTMAQDFPKAGHAFITATHRGKSYMADFLRKSATGYEYTQLGSAFDIFEDCIYDIGAWVKLAQKLGYKNIILQQHSTPHKIVWYYYKQKPKSVSALILVSPADIAFAFEKYVPNYKKNLKLSEQLIKKGNPLKLMPVPLWSNCPVSAKTFYNWGNLKSPIQEFNYTNPNLGFKYFPKIKCPMLAILGEKDFAVGEPAQKCLDILKTQATSKRFKTKLIKNAAHSYLGQEKQLTKAVTSWLKTTI